MKQITVEKIENGKIAEIWEYADSKQVEEEETQTEEETQ